MWGRDTGGNERTGSTTRSERDKNDEGYVQNYLKDDIRNEYTMDPLRSEIKLHYIIIILEQARATEKDANLVKKIIIVTNHNLCPPTVPPKINDNASTPVNPQVVLNQTIILNCDVSGTPTPTIEWLVDGRPLNPGPRFRLLSDNRQLEIVDAQVPDQARYTCIAKNPAGVANRDFDLDVLGTYPAIWSVVGGNGLNMVCEFEI